jgi:hypothetical protein
MARIFNEDVVERRCAFCPGWILDGMVVIDLSFGKFRLGFSTFQKNGNFFDTVKVQSIRLGAYTIIIREEMIGDRR